MDKKVKEKMLHIGILQHAANVQEQLDSKNFKGMGFNEKDNERRKNEQEGKIEKIEIKDANFDVGEMFIKKLEAEKKIAQRQKGFFCSNSR